MKQLIEPSEEEPPYLIISSTFGVAFGMLFFTWIGLAGGAIIGVVAGLVIDFRKKEKIKNILFKLFLALSLLVLGILNFLKYAIRPENSLIYVIYFISGAIFAVLGLLLMRKAYKLKTRVYS